MRWLVGLSLDLDPDTSFVRDVLEDAIVVVRFLHYPPSVEKDVTGIGAHTGPRFYTCYLPLECTADLESNTYHVNRPIRSEHADWPQFILAEGNPAFVVKPLGTDANGAEKFNTVEKVL